MLFRLIIKTLALIGALNFYIVFIDEMAENIETSRITTTQTLNNNYPEAAPIILLGAALELKHISHDMRIRLEKYFADEKEVFCDEYCTIYNPRYLLTTPFEKTFLNQMFNFMDKPSGRNTLITYLYYFRSNINFDIFPFEEEFLLLEKVITFLPLSQMTRHV